MKSTSLLFLLPLLANCASDNGSPTNVDANTSGDHDASAHADAGSDADSEEGGSIVRRELAIGSTKDIGALTMPPKIAGRDGGASGLVGGKVLWTFGDTFWPFKADDGMGYRTNTAALADLSAPLLTTEPLDTQGAPYVFIPFTDEEKAFNESTGKPDDRFAIWPGSVISDGPGGIIFYLKIHVKPGTLNYDFRGTGVARVASATTTATRDAGLLFGADEPHFNLASQLGDHVYVYGDLPGKPAGTFGVARVARGDVGNRSAYRFWSGAEWSEDVSKTIAVIDGIPGGATVSYNAYLGQYLAVHSQGVSNNVLMKTAPAPEGPWSSPIVAFTGMTPGDGGGFAVDYSGLEHVELARDGGKTVVVSYARPLPGFLEGEVRLVEVTFK